MFVIWSWLQGDSKRSWISTSILLERLTIPIDQWLVVINTALRTRDLCRLMKRQWIGSLPEREIPEIPIQSVPCPVSKMWLKTQKIRRTGDIVLSLLGPRLQNQHQQL